MNTKLSPTQLFIGPAGAALEDLQPISLQTSKGNFLFAEAEEPAEDKHFSGPELSFTVEGKCGACPPGLTTCRVTMHTDTRPRTYEATIRPEESIRIEHTDSKFAGLGDKVFFINAEDIHLVKKRQYRGCNKSKFYERYLRKRKLK